MTNAVAFTAANDVARQTGHATLLSWL